MTDDTRLDPPLDAVSALATLPVGVFISDAGGRIAWVNDTLCDQLGAAREALIGLERSALPARKTLSLSRTVEWLHTPGREGATERRFECITHRLEGFPGSIGCVIEVSRYDAFKQPRQFHPELKDPGKLDPMTGLLDQTTMRQELIAQVSRSRRYHNPLSVVLIRLLDDATHVEAVTDIQKQRLTKGISKMLKEKLRWVDIVGCWDKDAFMLMLPETALEPASKLVRKTESYLVKLRQGEERAGGVSMTVAVGVAEWTKGDDVNALLTRVENNCRERDDKPSGQPEQVHPSR
ncbi:MAG: diguanylate cyclase domain-containing protein [Chromatiales bacterium]